MAARWRSLAALMAAGLVACSGPQVTPREPDAPATPQDAWGPRPDVADALRSAFPGARRFLLRSKAGVRSGVELLVVERRAAPAVFLRWVLPGGRSHEFAPAPAAKSGKPRPAKPGAMRWPEGTVQLTSDLLTMGTRSHPDTAFAGALARHGGGLTATALSDAIVLEGQVLSHQLAPYLRLVREALVEPSLDARALENLRIRYRAELENREREAEDVANRLARQLVYGERHVYGSSGSSLATLNAIQRRHVTEAHAAAFALGGSTLVVVGDLDAATLGPLVEAIFGAALDVVAEVPQLAKPEPAPDSAACHLVNLPESVQTAIAVGNPAPARRTPDWPRLVLANQILGGSASSRLFTELREKRGLTYGIYSGFEGRRVAGQWTAATAVRTEVTGEALEVLLAEIARMRDGTPAQSELQAARRYLGGQFALSLASGEQVADLLAAVRLYDLPDDTFARYLDDLQSVTVTGTQAAAASAMGAAPQVIVLAGNAAAARPGIDASCPRLVERDSRGRQVRVWIGTDAEMGDEGRRVAFALWPTDPRGRVALARYVADTERAPAFRARALGVLAASEASGETLAIGRKAADWRQKLAPELAPLILALIQGPDAVAASRARGVALAMATEHSGPAPAGDLAAAGGATLRQAVALWAFAGLTTATPGEAVRAQGEARLAAGDVAKLGDASHAHMEHWIAADFRRHEAAAALVATLHRPAVTLPEAATATIKSRGRRAEVVPPRWVALQPEAALVSLVQGYRRLYGRGVVPDPGDLALLDKADRIETLLVLLDAHALHERSDDAGVRQAAARTMQTIRGQFARMQGAHTLDPARSDLTVQYPKLEAHFENLLGFRNADDRWLAARLLVAQRGAGGLRRVLDGLADDDQYRAAGWHTLDPKLALGQFARDVVAPLGASEVQPLMLAALAGTRKIAKVLAVTVLKALGDDGSIAALRTHTDDTDIAHVLDLPGPLSVRDLALAAVDVHKYLVEVDEARRSGGLSPDVAALHKEIAFFLYDFTDKRLRIEVLRQVNERLAVRTDALPADATATGAK